MNEQEQNAKIGTMTVAELLKLRKRLLANIVTATTTDAQRAEHEKYGWHRSLQSRDKRLQTKLRRLAQVDAQLAKLGVDTGAL
jgi:hypothetical protein